MGIMVASEKMNGWMYLSEEKQQSFGRKNVQGQHTHVSSPFRPKVG
jgi:hypothetical protein